MISSAIPRSDDSRREDCSSLRVMISGEAVHGADELANRQIFTNGAASALEKVCGSIGY
jgi:hypothetical protein